MISRAIILLGVVVGCLSAPMDDPIKIDLPVYDKPADIDQPETSNANFVPQYASENHPGGELLYNGNFFTNKLQALNGAGKNFDSEAFQGPFSPVIKIESAVHETEGYGSKALSIKENIQHVVAGLFQPEPVVDTISESEKYGNNGDKFYNAGQAIVGGASGVSNLVNSVLEVPSAIFKKITRFATEKLNNFGGKLIGL